MAKKKIICTIGPASSRLPVLRKMMLAGMDIARLNFSHGTHADHQKSIQHVRALNKKHHGSILIMQDLEGYRIRIGTFKDNKNLLLKKGQRVLLTNREELVDGGVVPFDYQGALSDITTGSFIYIDDGNIALKVRARSRRNLTTEVVSPGILKEGKGINIPGLKLNFKGLTNKDRDDVQFGIRNKVDFIAQSFVRNKQDIMTIREILGARGTRYRLIAKIESRDGIRNIDQIITAADGIMVARGDLGVSVPLYQVPLLQKMIIRKCNRRKKMVITATQMLESMTEHIRPTRAEVSDVANAILDGSDCLMLSAETAVGKFPVETVKMMKSIMRFTEQCSRQLA